MSRRILVTGSRQWTDRTRLEAVLWNEAFNFVHLGKVTFVHGACPSGADAMAHDWLVRHGQSVFEEAWPADWKRHGKAAGFIRNKEMVDLGADLCIAFIVPGKSPGTLHTVSYARGAGIDVCEVIDG